MIHLEAKNGFLPVILWLRLILCCCSALIFVCVLLRRPYVILDGWSGAVVIIQSLFNPHGKKATKLKNHEQPLYIHTHTHIECVCEKEWERGGGREGREMGETHFCCSSFSWNISHEYWQQLCCRRQKEMNRGCWSQRQHTVWESLATVTARCTARDNLNLSY